MNIRTINPSGGKSRLVIRAAEKREISKDFSRFFRPCIFSEFHRFLLPFSMLCPDSDSRKGLFASSRKQSVLRQASDPRGRRTVQKSPAFEKNPGCKGFTPKGTKNDRWAKVDTRQAGKRESKRLPLSCFFSLGQQFCSQNG